MTERDSGAVSAIDALTITVVAEIPTGNGTPENVVISPDDSRASGELSVIDLPTNSVSATIDSPEGAPSGIDLGWVRGPQRCPARPAAC
ncbi:YncE family protein [Streptomyces sp. ZAF1911]|uniref:YncE family protein n=1 Tax=Streptomyces sp. ZAF1911 TaxID=2944129 RepID=UPI003FD42A25